MDPHSPARAVLDAIWMLIVCAAAGLILFVASHRDSLGAALAILLWLAVWTGAVAVRRPRLVPDAVSVGIAALGVPLVLAAPAAAPPVVVACIVAGWVLLGVASRVYRRSAAERESEAM